MGTNDILKEIARILEIQTTIDLMREIKSIEKMGIDEKKAYVNF